MQLIRWRGWYSRAYKFDFYQRRDYIASLAQKMQKTRESLHEKCMELIAERRIANREQAKVRLDKIAGTKHHLIGTKAIEGVLTRIDPISPNYGITERNLKNNSELNKWYASVGKNPKGIIIKPVVNVISVDDSKKYAQGPFLVCAI